MTMAHAVAGEMPAPSTEDLTVDLQDVLERVDDAQVVQLRAEGFARLSKGDRILAYFLYRAAIAGRDIFWDQKYQYSLEIREWMEELFEARHALSPGARAEVERYTKLLWIHSGPHNHETSRKEPLRMSLQEFEVAVAAAERAGARFPQPLSAGGHGSFANQIESLYRVALNSQCHPVATNKSPGQGRDPLRESAVNLYEDVSMAEADAFDERYPLNSRLARRSDGTLCEEVYRCGGHGVPPGRYAMQIRRIVKYLRLAIAVAPEPTRVALEHLVRYYETGDPEDFCKYSIAWVADRDCIVDTVNGFIEVYCDPRGRKGAYEGIVSCVNFEKTAAIRRIAAHAAWFEARMPWADKYKKTETVGIVANAIDAIVETGDSGPVTPIGINLPNAQDMREKYGSKSVNISNVGEAYEKSTPPLLRREFCYDQAEFDRAHRWIAATGEIHTNMHEVIGHASGRLAEHCGGDPAAALGETYSTLEEARADLVALWFIGDPETIEKGMSPGFEAALAEYEGYTRSALLVQLRRVRTGDQFEEDHARNRALIANWIFHHSKAIERRKRGGKTFFVVMDREEWRLAAGRLLAEIMQIKGEGRRAQAKELIARYGLKFDPALRDEVVRRVREVNPPSCTAFVQPRLVARRGAGGEVLDVSMSYPRDLAQQMLEWSGRRPEPQR
jgi:dipeptidyl-peptidase-3